MGEYIYEIYRYAIAIVGIVAAVVIIFGGVMWITAGGNAARIDDAKAWIGAALIGLVLALFSYTVLKTINPELVKIQPIQVTEMGKPITCCHPEKGEAYFLKKENGDYIPTCTPQTEEDIEAFGSASLPECDDNQTCNKISSGYKCTIKDNGGCCGTKRNPGYVDYSFCEIVNSEEECNNPLYYHRNQKCEDIEVECDYIAE
jgi:hypothetical protein